MDLFYQQMFFTTLALAFGMLHLILFLYNKKLRSNLYFAIFAILYAANIFFDYQSTLSIFPRDEIFYLRAHRAVMPLSPIFALLFSYSILKIEIPKQFWLLVAGLLVGGALAVLEPVRYFAYIQFFFFGMFVEAIRVMFVGIRLKVDGAWHVAIGFSLLVIFSLYDMGLDLKLFSPWRGVENGYPFGFLGLIVFISAYLARDYAQTSSRIINKERELAELSLQQELLSAEDTRKSAELQEARDLQISMLPQDVERIQNVDVSFMMQPATEVGGDYYDYQVSEQEELTLAIGDATGHGMKAGIMVSIVKGLFVSLASELQPIPFLHRCSHAIKSMRLGNLYMALTIAKLDGRKLTVSSAGMPPFYHYCNADGQVREHILKGMPLGAFDNFPYSKNELDLEAGDTLLFLSDGLGEQFNESGEMFDSERIKEAFSAVADKSPGKISSFLWQQSLDWRKGREQADDITLVVLKMR